MKRTQNDEMNIIPDKISDALLGAIKPIQPSPVRASDLRTRVLNGIHAGTSSIEKDFLTIEKDQGEWINVSPLAAFKMLVENGDASSYLVRLKAGVRLPAHDHTADEECLLLEGDMWLGDLHLFAGDYHLAPKGKPHGDMRTENGALLFLRGPIAEPMLPFLQ